MQQFANEIVSESNVMVRGVSIKTPDSIRIRYFFKLFGNFYAGFLGLLQQVLLSRFLGSSLYGQWVFSRAHFQGVFTALEVGTGTAFSTFASQSQDSYKKVIGLFSIILFCIFSFNILYVVGVKALGLQNYFWPDIDPSYMGYGLFLAFGIYLSMMAARITDASGHSKKVEMLRGLVSSLVMLILGGMIYLDFFNIKTASVIIGFGYYAVAFYYIYFGHKMFEGGSIDYSRKTLKESWERFIQYCGPLFIFSVVGAFLSVIDRWLLQKHGGSVQQGYFGYSQQLSAAVFLITGSMSPIFHREASAAFFENKVETVKKLFLIDLRRFFSIAAFLSIIAAINAKEILSITVGEPFKAAYIVTTLMFLYPIHQTYGQLSSILLLAKGKTQLYLWISLVDGCLGLLCSYLLLSDLSFISLNLGAVGLAIKFLFVQLMDTSIYNFCNCKMLGLSFRRFLLTDIKILAALGCFGLVSYFLSYFILFNFQSEFINWFSLILKSTFFSSMVLLLVLMKPGLFALNFGQKKKSSS